MPSAMSSVVVAIIATTAATARATVPADAASRPCREPSVQRSSGRPAVQRGVVPRDGSWPDQQGEADHQRGDVQHPGEVRRRRHGRKEKEPGGAVAPGGERDRRSCGGQREHHGRRHEEEPGADAGRGAGPVGDDEPDDGPGHRPGAESPPVDHVGIVRTGRGAASPSPTRQSGRNQERARGDHARIVVIERERISVAVVTRLLAEQFPELATLPLVPVDPGGWDNATFRLGEELAVRLPTADAYVAQVEKEHRWLPVLAAHLPLPVPEPLATGRPGAGFLRPWSIRRWIAGEPASLARVPDAARFATDLAAFLGALQSVDSSTGPSPGEHNFFRGAPLRTYDAQARAAFRLLADDADVVTATDVWDRALASEWDRAPVWVHGDVAASNLLVADGDLRAVIDFGSAAVGDPACDLMIAWTFLPEEARAAFRRELPLDDATWERGRGWALWKAVVTLAEEARGGAAADAAAARMGWTGPASSVVEAVLADHRRSG